MDIKDMDWEVYDDQDGSGFAYVGYENLRGENVVEAIEPNLVKQAAEIRRLNGSSVQIKLYRPSSAMAVTV